MSSLLDLLQTLDKQLALLPSLHLQLDLPKSALEADLSLIRQKLLNVVAEEIESREQEVDDCAQMCEQLDSECVLFATALMGEGNIQDVEKEIGKLMEINALPKRHKATGKLLDQLKLLYKRKADELRKILERLCVVEQTLGHDFFEHDVFHDESPESLWDVTTMRFQLAQQELSRAEPLLNQRLRQLTQNAIEICFLYREFGLNLESNDIPAPPLPDPSTPSTSTRHWLPIHQEVAHIQDYRLILHRFCCFFNSSINSGATRLVDENGIGFRLADVAPTDHLLQWAEQLEATLKDAKRGRIAYIQAVYDQIYLLWMTLGVDEDYMVLFSEDAQGISQEAVQIYVQELERLTEIFQNHMKTIIGSAMSDLSLLWDELSVSEDEQRAFEQAVGDDYTELRLEAIEDEIERLREEKVIKGPLLESVANFFALHIREQALPLQSAARKRIGKEKAIIEKTLVKELPVWEQAHERPFLSFGESVLDAIDAIRNEAESDSKRTQVRSRALQKPALKRSARNQPSKDAKPRKRIRLDHSKARGQPTRKEEIGTEKKSQRESFRPRPSIDDAGVTLRAKRRQARIQESLGEVDEE